MDEGAEQITDAQVAAALRKQARGIQWHSVLLAIVLSAPTMLVPPM